MKKYKIAVYLKQEELDSGSVSREVVTDEDTDVTIEIEIYKIDNY